jgi:hypothetical protein
LGPRAILDAVVKRKIPSPRRESNPRTPLLQPIEAINERNVKHFEVNERQISVVVWVHRKNRRRELTVIINSLNTKWKK